MKNVRDSFAFHLKSVTSLQTAFSVVFLVEHVNILENSFRDIQD